MARQRRKELKDVPRKPLAAQHPRQCPNASDDGSMGPWAPQLYTAFKALFSARLCAAVWSSISDCDETFNYWEPTHFLMYGKGLQTWEYSPVYAIRSYAYLWLHVLPGLFYSSLLQSNRVLVFYFMRCILGFACSLCEVYFYRGVLHRFGPVVARTTLVLLLFSTGMFVSSTAYLPSTFSMYATLVATGGWFMGDTRVTVLATAIGALVGWPFSAALGLPAALDVVLLKRKARPFLTWCAVSLAIVLPALISVDSHYFGRPVLAPLNIVLYNVFSSHGANLYGVEPWTFYLKNGALNFNFAFPAALLAAPALALARYLNKKRTAGVLDISPMYLWFAIFFSQAHKEERFLFPVYPLVCLCAAVTLDSLEALVGGSARRLERLGSSASRFLWVAFLATTTLLSISRTVALYRNFRAPMEIYMELAPLAGDGRATTLCLGKEWYRFPSSFFLPENWQLAFLESEFRGQLPKPFAQGPHATRLVPRDMNDQNREERSRYVQASQCDYLVDTDGPDVTEREPNYSASPDWEVVSSIKFLDSKRSSLYGRVFYIPFVTERWCSYVNYNLLRRIKADRG
ncbi:alpha-1,2-mannosyltransferase ALG9 [Ixodes scapularis]|uniref:alpha-1,2-mannosyltransferase ALG9 n=1 Tax=Ixodes scapularis TaxID=6945 RepID=UPI001A9CE393|nr:alpha-1,2-mannosyltransferase ALG9 [Ixodes scapularis]